MEKLEILEHSESKVDEVTKDIEKLSVTPSAAAARKMSVNSTAKKGYQSYRRSSKQGKLE